MPRVKVDWSSGSPKNFKDFKKTHPEVDISSIEWRAVLYDFNEGCRDHVLETGDVIKLPERCGLFTITKVKTRTSRINKEGKEVSCLPIDWKKTKEKGRYIYQFNRHTEGFYFRWKWFRTSSTIKNADLWYFKPSRVTSRLVAHYVKSDDKYQHIYKQH